MLDHVVPYVGTWIEIYEVIEMWRKRPSRSLRGNVDRNKNAKREISRCIRRSLRGNVDRNVLASLIVNEARRSFPTWERG